MSAQSSTDSREHATHPTDRRKVRIALAHDWLVGYRGGEVVLETIALAVHARAPAPAPGGLYTMFAGPGEPRGTERRPEHNRALRGFGPARVSFLDRLPGAHGRLRRWMLPLYPAAVADLSRRLAREHRRQPIDLLISTSSAAVKGLRAPPGVPHLCYCHSPARYLWSQSAEYGRGRGGVMRGLGLGMFGGALRRWDRRSAANVDRFLANSAHTAGEIRRCYGRDAEVVFPPVDTAYFTPDAGVARGEHWLYAGALEPYKRVDLVIESANRARRPLVVAGEGSQGAHLRSLAGPTVTFTGRLDDGGLREAFRSARMLVFPQVEDFGIVAVEAQACGTPVLAFRAGGALDTVIEGSTGAFFERPTVESLVAGAARVPPNDALTGAACRRNAERFAEEHFLRAITRHIDELLATPRGPRSRPRP